MNAIVDMPLWHSCQRIAWPRKPVSNGPPFPREQCSPHRKPASWLYYTLVTDSELRAKVLPAPCAPLLTTYEAAGMAWWNNASETERAYWLARASSPTAADAFAAFRDESLTPNYCRICTPAGIGYCRCEIASNN